MKLSLKCRTKKAINTDMNNNFRLLIAILLITYADAWLSFLTGGEFLKTFV